MLPGLLLGVSLAKSTFHQPSAPALSTDDSEVLQAFLRIRQILNKINIAGLLSEPLDAISDGNRMEGNKTETESKSGSDQTPEIEENTECTGQGTNAILGENQEFLEDDSLKNPTTTTRTTFETEETTTDSYDFLYTAYPMYVLPVDYSYESDTDNYTEMYDLPENNPAKPSSPSKTVGGDDNVSNSQDVDSEEASGSRVGLNSGPEFDSGNTFKIALLALK